jgi:hypothetical protein
MMMRYFNPIQLGTELTYTLLIVLFCLMVFFKTKEIYDLTKHKGILFFRYSFIFFAIAYISRLFLFLLIFSTNKLSRNIMMRGSLMHVSHLIIGFFSTMAILYLVYSIIWKQINSEHFLTFSNIIALIIGVIAFIFRSHLILSLIQLFIMIIALIIIFLNHNKTKKKSATKVLYLLIFLFWFVSLLILDSKRLMPLEIQLFLQLMSVGIFVTIYIKVSKWIK